MQYVRKAVQDLNYQQQHSFGTGSLFFTHFVYSWAMQYMSLWHVCLQRWQDNYWNTTFKEKEIQ